MMDNKALIFEKQVITACEMMHVDAFPSVASIIKYSSAARGLA